MELYHPTNSERSSPSKSAYSDHRPLQGTIRPKIEN